MDPTSEGSASSDGGRVPRVPLAWAAWDRESARRCVIRRRVRAKLTRGVDGTWRNMREMRWRRVGEAFPFFLEGGRRRLASH